MTNETIDLIKTINSNLFRLCDCEDDFKELIILSSKLMEDCLKACDEISSNKSEGLETMIIGADDTTMSDIYRLIKDIKNKSKY